MKPVDDQLDRLFKAAAGAPKPTPTAAVFAQEARVLANWRSTASESDGGEWMVAAFRRAAICGGILAVTMATLAWNYHGWNGGGALAVADSVLQVGGVEP